MKTKFYFLFLLASILLASCSNEKSIFLKTFNPENLTVQEFKIKTERDTTVVSQGGVEIILKANSITSSSGEITLLWKEAMNISEMIEAGLFTESDGNILSSGGMFNINFKEDAEIVNPITINIPQLSFNDKMKLYKGEDKNGKINWTDPEEILVLRKEMILRSGESIYSSDCKSCHEILPKLLIGPPLGGLQNIRDKKWLYDFTRNNNKLREHDNLACCIYNEFHKMSMTLNENLTDKELDALYAYINFVMKNHGYDENYKPYRSCDSCEAFSKQLQKLYDKREKFIQKNNQKDLIQGVQQTQFDNGTVPKVTPEIRKAEYYSVTVKAKGWYNVDVMMKDDKNAQQSILTINIKSPVQNKFSLMLAIPSQRSFSEGGKLDDGSAYGFQGTDGKIYLTQNVPAYVFAFTEENNKIYFGIQQFNTSPSQNLSLTLSEMKKEQVQKIFRSLNFLGLNLDIEEIKNVDDIASIDKLLKELNIKSSNCFCNCGTDTSAIDSAK